MLTDTKLKNLKPREKTYKEADRDGLYVVVSPVGGITFRFDYRFNDRRETLTIGRYGPDAMSLADARQALTDARKLLHDGKSPAKAKADGKREKKNTDRFEAFAEIWMRDSAMADSTKAMRKRILDKDILPTFGNKLMEEITPSQVMALCEKIKARGAPAPAVQAREIVGLVYRHAAGRGLKIDNPAENIRPSAIATFKPRTRAMSGTEIGHFFRALEHVATLPTLRLATKFLLLTMCRKSEFVNATWQEIDFQEATWTIPADRMKADRPHVVPLSQQAMDILVALHVCAGVSPYLHPSRYEPNKPLSMATFNRVVEATVERIRADGIEFDSLSVHDLRRTASTLLHEAGFNTDWIEKSLAHEQKGVRAVYNKAEYLDQRREMLQTWSDMIDGWVAGASVSPINAARLKAA